MNAPAPLMPIARWRSSSLNIAGRIDVINGITIAPLSPITARMRMRPLAEVIWLAITEEMPKVTTPTRSNFFRPILSPSTPAGSMNPASERV